MWMCDKCQEINDDNLDRCPKCGMSRLDDLAAPFQSGAEQRTPDEQPVEDTQARSRSRLKLVPLLLGFGLVFVIMLFTLVSTTRAGRLETQRSDLYHADCSSTTPVSALANPPPCYEEMLTVVGRRSEHVSSGGRFGSEVYYLELKDAQGKVRETRIPPVDSGLMSDNVWENFSIGDIVSAQIWQDKVQQIRFRASVVKTSTNPDYRAPTINGTLPIIIGCTFLIGGAVGFLLYCYKTA